MNTHKLLVAVLMASFLSAVSVAVPATNAPEVKQGFPVKGVLTQKDEARVFPVKPIPIDNGWKTVVSGKTESDKVEILDDLVFEDSLEQNPYVINLSVGDEDSKNLGHMTRMVKRGGGDVMEAMATGRAVLCRYGNGESSSLSAIVYGDKQPNCDVCEKIAYQVLQLKKDEEHARALQQKEEEHASQLVENSSRYGTGAASMIGTGGLVVGACVMYVINSVK